VAFSVLHASAGWFACSCRPGKGGDAGGHHDHGWRDPGAGEILRIRQQRSSGIEFAGRIGSRSGDAIGSQPDPIREVNRAPGKQRQSSGNVVPVNNRKRICVNGTWTEVRKRDVMKRSKLSANKLD
jgi:hypothetical protein